MSALENIGPAFIAGAGTLPLKDLIRTVYFFHRSGIDNKLILVSGIFI